jgi:hypothetical protein
MAYRKSTHDAPTRPPEVPTEKPGTLPPNRIPIYAGGQRRGHVGRLASEAVVASHFGVRNPKLGKVDGRTAWIGQNDAEVRRQTELKKAQRVKQNKGSVSFKPTRPDKAVRPERGG